MEASQDALRDELHVAYTPDRDWIDCVREALEPIAVEPPIDHLLLVVHGVGNPEGDQTGNPTLDDMICDFQRTVCDVQEHQGMTQVYEHSTVHADTAHSAQWIVDSHSTSAAHRRVLHQCTQLDRTVTTFPVPSLLILPVVCSGR